MATSPNATKSSMKKVAQKQVQAKPVESNKDDVIKQLQEEVSKLKKDKAPSIQKKYAEYIKSLDIYSAEDLNGTDIDMLEWQTNYWKIVSKVEGISHAYKWLEKNYPAKADKEFALKCFETAKISLLNNSNFKEIPSNEIILPLKNKWLMIDESNPSDILVIDPIKSYKIKYLINSEVDKVKVEGNKYFPSLPTKGGLFDTYISNSLPEEVKQNLLQQYCGYTLISDTRYQTSLWNVGNGSNGKGIILTLLEQLHSSTISVNMEDLGGFELDELPRASLVVVPEVEPKGFNEALFKQIIAGDKTKIRIKNKNGISIKPRAKWIIMCNDLPRIKDQTDGVMRRMIIINWDKQFFGKDRVVNLDKKIVNEEYVSFVDWCLIGLQNLLKQGDFIIPELLTELKENYVMNNNSVKSFLLNTEIELDETGNFWTTKADFYEQYLKYCERNFIENTFAPNRFWSIVKSHYKNKIVESRKKVTLDGLSERVLMVNLTFPPTIPEFGNKEGLSKPKEPEHAKPVQPNKVISEPEPKQPKNWKPKGIIELLGLEKEIPF